MEGQLDTPHEENMIELDRDGNRVCYCISCAKEKYPKDFLDGHSDFDAQRDEFSKWPIEIYLDGRHVDRVRVVKYGVDGWMTFYPSGHDNGPAGPHLCNCCKNEPCLEVAYGTVTGTFNEP